MVQAPGDGHRALVLVGDVGGGAEEGVGGGDSMSWRPADGSMALDEMDSYIIQAA